MRVLFASSEAYPLMKTGGLGDVSNSLPNSLQHAGADVRLVMPAYRGVLQRTENVKVLGWLKLGMQIEARILETEHPAFAMPVWLIDHPVLFDRPGNPYIHPDGYEWRDNPTRFNLLSRVAASLAMDGLGLGWRADVVHANDWQTGLLCAYLALEKDAPKSIFTIHNIAYDCQFDYGTFQALHLPMHWWSMDFGEFHHRFSMLKAGMMFSDHITTVSPGYAHEIRTHEYGYGYAPILESLSYKLTGILNGIDEDVWNPATDPYLVGHYSSKQSIKTVIAAKQANKHVLLERLGATQAVLDDIETPLLGFVGRLVFQKGIDLLLHAMESLIRETRARFVIIGSGEDELENHLRELRQRFPERIFSYIGYSEELAHLLEAGCDMFIMPSRYEPCGLNQMYSLRYGTPPVVRRTGGLADTVTDATGVLFDDASAEALEAAVKQALSHFDNQKLWQKMVENAMQEDFSWHNSAKAYLCLYDSI